MFSFSTFSSLNCNFTNFQKKKKENKLVTHLIGHRHLQCTRTNTEYTQSNRYFNTKIKTKIVKYYMTPLKIRLKIIVILRVLTQNQVCFGKTKKKGKK